MLISGAGREGEVRWCGRPLVMRAFNRKPAFSLHRHGRRATCTAAKNNKAKQVPFYEVLNREFVAPAGSSWLES